MGAVYTIPGMLFMHNKTGGYGLGNHEHTLILSASIISWIL
jgi:hypothetical protein